MGSVFKMGFRSNGKKVASFGGSTGFGGGVRMGAGSAQRRCHDHGAHANR